MQTLPISLAVNVGISATAPLLTADDFTSKLIVSTDTTTQATVVATYTSITEVAEHFANTTQTYVIASKLFAQSPRPKNIYIGKAGATMSALEQIQAVFEQHNGFYAFCFATPVAVADIPEVVEWAEANYKMPFFVVTDLTEATALGNTLKNLSYARYNITHHNSAAAVGGFMGMAMDQRFEDELGLKTLKFKTVAGVEPIVLTSTQVAALNDAGVNFYASYGNPHNPQNFYADGYAGSKKYFDFVVGLDWLRNSIEVEVYNTFRSQRKVPQTEAGMALLTAAVARACQKGVEIGLIAPGRWNGQGVGSVETGDMMQNGYYIYAGRIADQSQSERETRKAPNIIVLVKGGGALHYADITIVPEA